MAEIKANTPPAAAAASPAAPAKPKAGQPLDKVLGVFKDSRNQLNIKLVNVLLFCCAAAMAVRLGVIIDSSVKDIRSIDFRISGESGGELKDKMVLRKTDYYLEKVKKRDIFKMGAIPHQDQIEAGPSSKAVEATQNFKLVGISWSDDPDAMVEDIKTSKTWFVKKGQFIGEVKVENITRDRVTLRYGQDLIEIK
ncbi:MAG: hypothetical protein ACM3OC_08980 [Deltaproteobacteria bacterium]